MAIDPRMIQASGSTVLSSARMLIKGALEDGVETIIGSHLGCPASVPDLLESLSVLFEEKGLRQAVLPDAEQATAAAVGAWSQGQQVLSIVDAPGLVESASTLRRFVGINTPATSAWVMAFGPSDLGAGREGLATLRGLGVAVLEPGLQEEPKDWVAHALAMSRATGRPVALALNQGIYEGLASVHCYPNRYADAESSISSGRASRSTDPLETLLSEARERSLNQIINPAGKDERLELGLVATGPGYAWVRQVLAELGLVGRLPILRLGLRGPIDTDLVLRQAMGCRRLVVVDGPSGLFTREVMSVIEESEREIDCEVSPLLAEGEHGLSAVVRGLLPLLESHPGLPPELTIRSVKQMRDRLEYAGRADLGVPKRGESPPPGSSLLDLAVVLGQLRRDLGDAQYMTEQHSAAPVDFAVIGELDDASRRLLERAGPLPLWLAMDGRVSGSGAAALSGGPALRAVALMTSRRFFSQGIAAIAHAVRAGRSATFIVHTEEPTDAAMRPRRRLLRRRVKQHATPDALEMQAIIEALATRGGKARPSVVTLDPSDRTRMRRLLERSVLADGVRVIIARRRRGPRFYRRQRQVLTRQSSRKGYVSTQQFLVHCPEAGELTARRRLELGVLGVERFNDHWHTGISWTSADQSLFRALGDPAIGLATVERTKPKRSRVVESDLESLPPLPRPIHAGRETWRCCVAGLVGTTVDLTLAMLLEAGHAMGYQVRATADPETIETANPITGQVLFTQRDASSKTAIALQPGRAIAGLYSAWATPGGADLLLGAELLEAARAVDSSVGLCVAAAGHTAAICDTQSVPNLESLDAGQVIDDRPYDIGIRLTTDPELSAHAPIAQLSERLWGHQRFAAWVALGLAMQRGLIPVTTKAVDQATLTVLGVRDPRCEQALNVGRKIAVDPAYAAAQMEKPERTLDDRIAQLAQDLSEQWKGKGGPEVAREYSAALNTVLEHCENMSLEDRRALAESAQRCVLWAGLRRGMDYARRYLDAVTAAYDRDREEQGYELTALVIEGVGRAMLVPDETYLATLLTSPMRYRRDRNRLNLAPEHDDRISYQHTLRPEFDLFNRHISFTLTVGERILRWLSRAHALRRIRPGWYREQRDYRDAYLLALKEVSTNDDAGYRKACDLAKTALALGGRGETRRATIRTARRRLERLLPGEAV